jgi:PPM family protein phosphatase
MDLLNKQLSWAALTHPGTIHKQNQDSVLLEQSIHQSTWHGFGQLEKASKHLFAISDGVSQSPNPSKASRTILEGLHKSWLKMPDARPVSHKESIQNYLDKNTSHKLIGMSATLVAALYNGLNFTIFNSGDSRAYLIDQQGIIQLSKDHTILQRMLDEGEITKDEAANAASLYNGLDQCFFARSLDGPPRIQVYTTELQYGQYLLLCSDGLNLYISDDEIKNQLLNSESCETAVTQLFDLAIARGGVERITFQ